MKNRREAGDRRKEPPNGVRRQQRLGGKGLSLEAFAAAKSRSSHNPGEIKKHREFYQNAKKVQKYKKLKRKLESNHEQITDQKPDEPKQRTEPVEGSGSSKHRKKKGFGFFSKLTNEYEKKQREADEEKEERERAFAAKQQAREQAEQRRKQTKEKMLKKTSRGQPIMKHRLEQILDSFESSRHEINWSI